MMPCLLEPIEHAAFFDECTLVGADLDNARLRIMHCNKYETNYAPNVLYIKNTTL